MNREDLDRCGECGSRLVNDPDRNAKGRLAALGYLAQDAYHDHPDGKTYHGHDLGDDRADHDGFGEVMQAHESETAHEIAREHFEAAAVVCPRHFDELTFTKSVAPSSDPSAELYAQGKCRICENVVLVEVQDA